MVALLAILDPPRDEAIEAVKVAHGAGITVKMITGGGPQDGSFVSCSCYVHVYMQEFHCIRIRLYICMYTCVCMHASAC